MALLDAWLAVDFQDAPGKISTQKYLMAEQYDTATPATISTVITNATDAIALLQTMTMDHIDGYRIELAFDGAGAAANVAANNQVHAFTRVVATDLSTYGFSVPAWDDVVFAQNQDNMLSALYNVSALAFAQLTRNPENGQLGDSVSWSQSRTRKARFQPSG